MRYIYLLRHGNPGQVGDERRCLGSTDVALSDYGRVQLAYAKEFICQYDWTKVYTSPMCRCLETAECLDIPEDALLIREDLKEMSAGIWENLTFSEIKRQFPLMYEERGKALGTYAVAGAESFLEAGQRFAACMEEIRKESEENLLVITHAGVIRAYLCQLTGKSADEVMAFSIPYGSITVLQEEDGVVSLIDEGLRSQDLLDEEEICRIYRKYQTSEHVIAHMKMVAQVTKELTDGICRKLIKGEQEILPIFSEREQKTVYLAALLHDIRRTEQFHARKSAEALRREGYKEVAEIVALHHSCQRNPEDSLALHEILFYADKLVLEERRVSVDKRFAKSFAKCKGIPEAEYTHQQLFDKTVQIGRKIKACRDRYEEEKPGRKKLPNCQIRDLSQWTKKY